MANGGKQNNAAARRRLMAHGDGGVAHQQTSAENISSNKRRRMARQNIRRASITRAAAIGIKAASASAASASAACGSMAKMAINGGAGEIAWRGAWHRSGENGVMASAAVCVNGIMARRGSAWQYQNIEYQKRHQAASARGISAAAAWRNEIMAWRHQHKRNQRKHQQIKASGGGEEGIRNQSIESGKASAWHGAYQQQIVAASA